MTVPIIEQQIELPDTAVAALVESEGQQQDTISDNLIATILAIWLAFTSGSGDGVYDGVRVQRMTERIGRLVVAAQRQAARVTEAHLRLQIQSMGLGDAVLPRGPIADLPESLRLGASPEEVYNRPVRQVRYLEAVEDVPRETAIETARERLEKAALHDLQLARAVTAQQVLYRFPQATGWRRIIHPELGSVCGLCIAAADRVYQRINRMDIHPGCVIEGTEVSAAGVGAATRRWYEGPIAVLRTASGQELRLTGQHPVLTEQGWVAADRLRVGDRVVRHGGGYGDVGGRPDEQHAPARAEDVWRALTVRDGFLPRAVPLAPEDLHGEEAEGEVDVVLVDRHLAPVGDTTFIEPCRELGLGDAHGRWTSFAAAGSFDLLGMGLLVPAASTFGVRADRYFSPSESADDRGPAYAELGRNLLDRLAGQVDLDEVVQVEVEAFRGHVYNFQTVEGWYAAAGIVVSNCKCTVLPVVGGLDPGGQLNAADLKRLYEAAGSTDSRALAKLRIETIEHGEMGPVLVPEGAGVKTPQQAKRQISDEQLDRRKAQLQRQVDELRRRDEQIGGLGDWDADRLKQLENLLAAA